jgi:hypothetical protein
MDFPTQSKKNQITPNRKWQLIWTQMEKVVPKIPKNNMF